MDKRMKMLNHALVAVLITVLTCSCAKAPIDGDIEGFWQLNRFVTLSDGQTHSCERIYYGITRYVVEVAEKQGPNGYGAFVGRFEYVDGSNRVVMSNFKQRFSTSDNGIDASVEELHPFGLNSTSTTFRVVVANGNTLVLESDYARLELTRF